MFDIKSKKVCTSPTGNRTPVSRVTGGDTYHYTIEDWLLEEVLEFCALRVSSYKINPTTCTRSRLFRNLDRMHILAEPDLTKQSVK